MIDDENCTCDDIGGFGGCPDHPSPIPSRATLTPEGEAHLAEMMDRFSSHVQHDWMFIETFAYSDLSECKRCGACRYTWWTPGWPPARDYYTPDGQRTANSGLDEPKCCERDR